MHQAENPDYQPTISANILAPNSNILWHQTSSPYVTLRDILEVSTDFPEPERVALFEQVNKVSILDPWLAHRQIYSQPTVLWNLVPKSSCKNLPNDVPYTYVPPALIVFMCLQNLDSIRGCLYLSYKHG